MSNVAEVRARGVRRLRVVGIVCAVLVGCVVATFLSVTWPPSTTRPITVTDAAEIVSIDLPAGWVDTTADDAGEISTVGDSGEGVLAYRVPDISAHRDFDDDDTSSGSWLDVTIDVPTRGVSHRTQHLAQVQKVIEDFDATFTPPESIADISGHPALRSSGKVAGSSGDLFVITIFTDHEYLITITGDTALHREPGWDNLPTDPRREELARLVAQARIP